MSSLLRAPRPGQAPPAPSRLNVTGARLYLHRDAANAGFLWSLRNVRAGVGQRLDGDGRNGADRQGLRYFQHDRISRLDDAHRGAGRRQRPQRPRAPVLWLGFRHHRSREHHGDRLHARWGGLLAAGDDRDPANCFHCRRGPRLFHWGEIFSLFPATCTDTYGSRYATTNAGWLYRATGASVWLVPLATLLKDYTGSWHGVFVVATLMNLTGWRPWRSSC